VFVSAQFMEFDTDNSGDIGRHPSPVPSLALPLPHISNITLVTAW